MIILFVKYKMGNIPSNMTEDKTSCKSSKQMIWTKSLDKLTSPDFSQRVSEGDVVAGRFVGAVILSPHFGQRTPVVRCVHRRPRTAGVLRFAQDDSIEAFSATSEDLPAPMSVQAW